MIVKELVKNYLYCLGKRASQFKQEQGYTLLEYCAGAAILLGIVYVALQTMGTNLSELINALAAWASGRAQKINEVNSSS